MRSEKRELLSYDSQRPRSPCLPPFPPPPPPSLITRTIDESLIELIIPVTMRCRTRETEIKRRRNDNHDFPARRYSAGYIMRSPSSFPANTYLHRAHFHCARSSGSNIRHGPLLYRLHRPIPNGAKLSTPAPPPSILLHACECMRLSLSFFCCFYMHSFRARVMVRRKQVSECGNVHAGIIVTAIILSRSLVRVMTS